MSESTTQSTDDTDVCIVPADWSMERVRRHLGNQTGYRPEKRWMYHNLGCVWSLQESEEDIRVAPRPLKYEWLIPTIATIFVAVFMTFALPALMRHGGKMSLSAAYALSAVPLTLGIFGAWLPFVYAHRKAKTTQPIMVWKKGSSVVELPTLTKTISISSIVRIEWISVRQSGHDEWAERNPVLCVRANESRLEWIPLLVGSSGRLDRALQTLADRLCVPFVLTSIRIE